MHDLVTLGEVMLRLAIPSPTRIETVTQLDVQIGGAEANVAAAKQLFACSPGRSSVGTQATIGRPRIGCNSTTETPTLAAVARW